VADEIAEDQEDRGAIALPEIDVKQVSENLGVQLDFREIAEELWWDRSEANEHQLTIWFNDGSEHLDLAPNMMLPVAHSWSGAGPAHATWVMTDGEGGIEPPEDMQRAQQIWLGAYAMDFDERNEAMQEIWEIITDGVWCIGTVGLSPMVVGTRVVNTNLKNNPDRQINSFAVRTSANSLPYTFFYDE
jgi:peptide/nickel transport system substrate-binding protein